VSIDIDAIAASLNMEQIIKLQNALSRELVKRFEKPMAVAFSDIVGSTAYFARHGDEAGRKLQQRQFDLLNMTLPKVGGRVVETAGDGAYMAFPDVDAAADGLIDFLKQMSLDNLGVPREHQLTVRVGIHHGHVLTDGKAVTGDTMRLGSKVQATAEPNEIRVSRDAFIAFKRIEHRLKCKAVSGDKAKLDMGGGRPLELMVLDWRDWSIFPETVKIDETGETIKLPSKDIMSFGRLREHDGVPANDVVIALPDKVDAQKISRWHFELRRRPDGYMLHPLSEQVTEVDGHLVTKGNSAPVRPGTVVRLAQAATLRFLGRERSAVDEGGTLFQG
jgi:class 3 adenylate cyclase